MFVATDADLTDTTPTDVITNFLSVTDKLVLGTAGLANTYETSNFTIPAFGSDATGAYTIGGRIVTYTKVAGSAATNELNDVTFTAFGAHSGTDSVTVAGVTVTWDGTTPALTASDIATVYAGGTVSGLTKSGSLAAGWTASTTGATAGHVKITATATGPVTDLSVADIAVTGGGVLPLNSKTDGVAVVTATTQPSVSDIVSAFTTGTTSASGLVVSGTLVTGYTIGAGTNSSTDIKFTGTTYANLTDVTAASSGAGGAAPTVTKVDGASGNYVENTTSVASIDALLTAADLALDGTVDFYFGVTGGNGYLVQDEDGTEHTNLIKLNGVLDMAAGDIIATTA